MPRRDKSQNTPYAREWRDERLAMGLCSVCGGAPPRPGKKSCVDCAAWYKEYDKKRRRGEDGNCTSCSGRKAEDGLKQCRECRDKANAAQKRYHEKLKVRIATENLCIECKQPRDREGKYCVSCLKKHRVRRYKGLTVEQLDALPKFCQICGAADKEGFRSSKLHVDHDHATGEIRGMLCDNCNKGLGCFKDDPDRLIAAANYVRKFAPPEPEYIGSCTAFPPYVAA